MELRRFASLQRDLLKAWRESCPDATDEELLLDFPHRLTLTVNGTNWEAARHGAGVRFFRIDITVDVPHGIAHPDCFDPNRFFDYLVSTDQLALIPGPPENAREALADLFSQWNEANIVQKTTDDLGRHLFHFGRESEDWPNESSENANEKR